MTAFGGAVARANAINDLGEIVGSSSNRALLYSSGRLIDLGTLGGSSSEAHGINATGQIVGGSSTTNGEWHAFLYCVSVWGEVRLAAYLLTPLPVLATPYLSNGTFRVSVVTAPAQTYILEFNDSLADTNLIELPPPVIGDGTVKVFTDPDATEPQRFYRARTTAGGQK